jgi:hypothetical protein
VVAVPEAQAAKQADGKIGLAEAISQVRAGLEVAIAEGLGSGLAFRADSVELESEVVLARDVVGGEAGVHVWVVSLGPKGEVSNAQTQRVRLALTPVNRPAGKNPLINEVARK